MKLLYSKTLLLVAVTLFSGCAGLKLTMKNSSVQKPSNVALYFSVETKNNIPVPGLSADMFQIYEDDQLISPFESKQTILNPEVAVAHYTILLLDLSGSITESGTLPTLIDAATIFSERITKNEYIAVYGFDGGPALIPIVASTTNAADVSAGLKRLANYKVSDPSTNLNGAIVDAVGVLNSQIAKSQQPLRFGTLVVFTDGTDRAHRVADDSMYTTIRNADLSVFAIGVGGEISAKQLERISTAGYIQATDLGQIALAFNGIADIIEAASRKFYLLSYCSPSRAGSHNLRVEVLSNDMGGSLSHSFDANGFGPGCDPNKKPTFKTGKIVAGDTHIPKNSKSAPISDSK
jgi:hypothetical protein